MKQRQVLPLARLHLGARAASLVESGFLLFKAIFLRVDASVQPRAGEAALLCCTGSTLCHRGPPPGSGVPPRLSPKPVNTAPSDCQRNQAASPHPALGTGLIIFSAFGSLWEGHACSAWLSAAEL